jgi:5-methyltetrahydropteroyltriglutamate--homocysteine methyltransferase
VKRSDRRILTTHVGSLPRPKAMLEMSSWTKGPPQDKPAYLRLLRDSVKDIVRRQAEAGIDIVNDGEFGKAHWASYIVRRLSGFELRPDMLRQPEFLGSDRFRFPAFFAETQSHFMKGAPAEACVGPIRYADRESIGAAVAALVDALKETRVEEAFMTAVAPASTAYDGVNEYYDNERDYVFAIADALAVEYRAIHDGGLIVQVDDALLANMFDTLNSQSPGRYREWAQLRIEALNHALRDIPEHRIRYHVCFGSWHVPHVCDAELEDIIGLILQVKAGAYLIEAANPRHEHEWRVWEKHRLPEGRILIPGVITHHVVTVEHPRLVADRIVRYANLVGRENVIAGTDCGFAQVDHYARVHPEVMWAKFESLAEGARIASQELWG